jgi:hypothetical protein
MTALEKIAFYRKRRDEVPNQELAAELAKKKDKKGVAEIAAHLWDRNQNVRSDCLKVLYEIGYLEPALIAPHTEEFLKLLDDRENRMVWGAMIALGTVADRRPKAIAPRTDQIMELIYTGSVITVVWGVRVLAKVGAAGPAYKKKIYPFLLDYLGKSIPRDVPTHGESMLALVGPRERKAFLARLRQREPEMTAAQKTRLKKLIRSVESTAE